MRLLFDLFFYLPEIRDPARSADPSSSHHHHPLTPLLSDAVGNILQGLPLLSWTTTMGDEPSRPTPTVCLSGKKQQMHNLKLLVTENKKFVTLR